MSSVNFFLFLEMDPVLVKLYSKRSDQFTIKSEEL